MSQSERKPLVSIVLPVYNGEKFLAESIESCCRQTYERWELLIIDDGSSDNTEAIARSYAEKDERISYYRNSKNLKLPRTLNRGFSMAKGRYLTWTSDDNYYRPSAIEKMVDALQKSESEFVFAACLIIDENGKNIGENRAPKEYRHAIWSYNFIGACFLYSREVYKAIGEYDPRLFLCEDYDYWLRIFAHFRVEYLDEELYVYRQHQGALSQTHKYQQYQVLEEVLKKNFDNKEDATMLDRFYLYKGLNRSCSLQKSLYKKYRYMPKLICYKVWHKLQRADS